MAFLNKWMLRVVLETRWNSELAILVVLSRIA
jgi:hypothetical protein